MDTTECIKTGSQQEPLVHILEFYSWMRFMHLMFLHNITWHCSAENHTHPPDLITLYWHEFKFHQHWHALCMHTYICTWTIHFPQQSTAPIETATWQTGYMHASTVTPFLMGRSSPSLNQVLWGLVVWDICQRTASTVSSFVWMNVAEVRVKSLLLQCLQYQSTTGPQAV